MTLKSLELFVSDFFSGRWFFSSFRFRSFICPKCGTDKHSHDNFDVSYLLFSRRSCNVRHTWDTIINFQYETMLNVVVGGGMGGERTISCDVRSGFVLNAEKKPFAKISVSDISQLMWTLFAYTEQIHPSDNISTTHSYVAHTIP